MCARYDRPQVDLMAKLEEGPTVLACSRLRAHHTNRRKALPLELRVSARNDKIHLDLPFLFQMHGDGVLLPSGRTDNLLPLESVSALPSYDHDLDAARVRRVLGKGKEAR